MNRSMRLKLLICVPVALCFLSGCNQAHKSEPISNSVEDEMVQAMGNSQTPTPNYEGEDGGTYMYVTAISDDDKKAGKALGDVVQYRFVGEHDGKLFLNQVDTAGKIIGEMNCPRSCRFIVYTSGAGKELLPYDPTTIAGSVIQDAINGFLKSSSPKKAAAIATPASVPQTVFSSSEQQLITKADDLNDKCRGGDGDNIEAICDERDRYYSDLKLVDICWGPADGIEADKHWLRCSADTTANSSLPA